MTQNVVFFIFAIAAVALAIGVVTTRRILRAAVYLTGVLFCGAAFYVMLQVEFLAGVQVLVYIGGIVVLLVFAVMLTSSTELLEDQPSRGRQISGLLGAAAFFALTAGALWNTDFQFLAAPQRTESDVHEIGRRLLDSGTHGYVLPFEVISVLLLASVIGGIVVARKVRDPEHGAPLPAGPSTNGTGGPGAVTAPGASGSEPQLAGEPAPAAGPPSGASGVSGG